MNATFGWISFAVTFLSYIPYLIDTVKGNTKPERASWFIWAVVGAIFVATQTAEGGRESVLLSVAVTVGPIAVLVLSVKYGVGGFLLRDKIALLFTAAALFLWYLTDIPAVALWIAILIDASAVMLTAIKTYEDPSSELPLFWAAGLFGGIFSMLAVGSLDVTLLAHPVYFIIHTAMILGIILYRSHQLKTQA